MTTSSQVVSTIKLPRQFEFRNVSKFMHDTNSLIGRNGDITSVVFDFEGVKWISAEGVVSLSTTVRRLQRSGYKTGFSIPHLLTSPVIFCNDCDFFRIHFGSGIAAVPRLRQTSFPLEFLASNSFNQGYIDNLIAWLKVIIGNHYSFGTLYTALGEVFNNVIDHSGSLIGAVVFAQHYPIKGYIELCISDAGVGIANSIRACFPQFKNDATAIMYSVKPRVSTKPTPRNRGAGLDTIRTIMEQHKGILRIVANNGLIEWDFCQGDTPAVMQVTDFAYDGTLITLRFPTSSLDEEDLTEEDLSW